MDFSAFSTQANPLRAEPDWPPVVVGGAFQTGLNLMRDLLRKGVRTVAVDHDLSHEGFRSRYGETFACPNPDTDAGRWAEFMKALKEKLGRKPVFIPAADVYVMAIGHHGPELAGHYLNEPEAARLQAELCSKETQYALCATHGFPCPRLQYVRSAADLERFFAVARFPCLIKPLSPRAWADLPAGNPARNQKVLIADDAGKLRDWYRQLSVVNPDVIAQEVIAGPGSQKRLYLSVFGQGGQVLSHCVMQELRPYPAITGMPSVVCPVQNEALTSLCAEFLSKLKYRGICEVELKLDERDGQPRLIEINPRFSGSGDSASYAGVETGWLHYLEVIGFPVKPVPASQSLFHHIALKIEAADTTPFLLNGSISLGDFLAPYRTRRAYFDLDWHDRGLALTTLRRAARYAAGSVWRHFTKRG